MTWNPAMPRLGEGAIDEAADKLGHPPPAPVAVEEFPGYPRQQDLGGRRRKTLAPYRIEWDQDGQRHRLTIRAHFKHDGASVPRIVWSAFPPHELDPAGVGHDYPYKGKLEHGDHEIRDGHGVWRPADPKPRKFWDIAFRIWLGMLGVSRAKKWAAYFGVRAGGRRPWKRGND